VADSFAVRKHGAVRKYVEIIVVPFAGWGLLRQGEMNPVERVRIGNIAGLGLEKDAAERISSTRGKYEAGKKEPRVGGARGSGRQKGARGD
jgi:hypothetical protein